MKELEIFYFPSVLILSSFGNSIPFIIRLFFTFHYEYAIFSVPNSIYISWVYNRIVCIRVSNLFYTFKYFLHQLWLMGFHWSLSDNNSSQVFRTFLSILANLSNAVVNRVSCRRLISKSFSSFIILWGLLHVHQLQLVSSSLSCSIVFCYYSCKVKIFISLFVFF